MSSSPNMLLILGVVVVVAAVIGLIFFWKCDR
jgi:nitrogen fixation-related uncharacterized protein